MSKNDRFRRAVRGVWEHSHARYGAWPEPRRAAVEPAIKTLLAWLADASTEAELIGRYWETGDPPGAVLHPHLPAGFDPEDALIVQEECFWRRAAEIEGDRDA